VYDGLFHAMYLTQGRRYVTTAVCIIGLFRNFKYFTEHRVYGKEIILKGIQLFALRNCIAYVRREADSYM